MGSFYYPVVGGSGSGYPTVADYSSLPPASSANGSIYAVLASTGIYFINRRPAGFYVSDGANWTYLAEETEAYFRTGVLEMQDSTDPTKVVDFDLSGLTTGTTRTVTMPDKSGTLAMLSDISGGGGLSQAEVLTRSLGS